MGLHFRKCTRVRNLCALPPPPARHTHKLKRIKINFSGHVTGNEMPSSPQYVGKFSISNGGVITAVGVLDRETRANYTLDVRASDLDPVHPRHNTTVVEIEVVDSNDNSPVFRNASYVAGLKEHSGVGSVAVQVRLFSSLFSKYDLMTSRFVLVI